MQVHVLQASSEHDFDTVFVTSRQLGAGALVIEMHYSPTDSTARHMSAAPSGAAISENQDFAAAGDLMSYGCSFTNAYRLLGAYTGRILKGEKARRPAGAAGHESRADHQHEDRQGARSHLPNHAAGPREWR